jgi:hypothetical protein
MGGWLVEDGGGSIRHSDVRVDLVVEVLSLEELSEQKGGVRERER